MKALTLKRTSGNVIRVPDYSYGYTFGEFSFANEKVSIKKFLHSFFFDFSFVLGLRQNFFSNWTFLEISENFLEIFKNKKVHTYFASKSENSALDFGTQTHEIGIMLWNFFGQLLKQIKFQNLNNIGDFINKCWK